MWSIGCSAKKLGFLAFLWVFAICPVVQGQAKALDAETMRSEVKKGLITMNFRDVEIQVLIKFISDLTGRNFLVDPAVKGNVTILCPEKVTIDEAYRVFLSTLEVQGFTPVETGKVIKIIPSATARTKGTETLQGGEMKGPEDRIITQMVPLKTANAGDIAKALLPLVEKTGALIPYPETNTLILIDSLSNVNRLLRIIAELDVSGSEEVRVFGLKHAKAEELAKRLLPLFQDEKGRKEGGGGDKPAKLIADDRTNSVVAMAEPKAMAKIGTLVAELDREIQRPRENIHMYNLENARAEELVKVLTELPGKGGKEEKDKAKPAAPAPLSKDIQISADKATNTLIIVAEPEEYQILQRIIRNLDRPRIMVYVEALIMEVSASKAMDLGVEWRVGNEYKGGYGAGKEGGVWFGGSTGPDNDTESLSKGLIPGGFAAGVLGKGITLGTVTFPTIAAFVKAVRSDSDFNILSTPQILTIDNEEAMIEVAKNIPFVTRVDQGVSTTDRAIQSFQYKNVGVVMKVTPQINENRFVRLHVEQKVEAVISDTALGGTVLAPTTTVRNAKTTIAVKDGETAVIGGLLEKRMERGNNMTPCLGGLPGAGWLFKSVSDRDEKTNLLVFITPIILENREEVRSLYEKKRQEANEETRKTIEKGQPELLRRKAFE
ncbi:MAG: type II secretion system secretin GspD [Thermodesulfobacteriota bacterium]